MTTAMCDNFDREPSLRELISLLDDILFDRGYSVGTDITTSHPSRTVIKLRAPDGSMFRFTVSKIRKISRKPA